MELKDIFYINEKDWYKLQAWATLAHDEDKNEISGLMTAIPQEDGRFKIGNVEILKQENTGTNTELDGDAVSAYMMKYGMKYNNPEMKFVWWHSHHTMQAFWSGTDVNEIEAWENNSFSLALVINLKEEYVFRISFWKTNGLPIEQHVDTTLTIERKEPKIKILDSMKKQYKELCSSPQIVGYARNQNRNGWGYNIHNPKQSHLWQRNETELNIENSYAQALEQAEALQDGFVDGTLQFKDWKVRLKEINKVCKDNKLPFRMIDWKFNKNQLLNKLMTLMPNELFDWDDKVMQQRAETLALNDSFGGNVWR